MERTYLYKKIFMREKKKRLPLPASRTLKMSKAEPTEVEGLAQGPSAGICTAVGLQSSSESQVGAVSAAQPQCLLVDMVRGPAYVRPFLQRCGQTASRQWLKLGL